MKADIVIMTKVRITVDNPVMILLSMRGVDLTPYKAMGKCASNITRGTMMRAFLNLCFTLLVSARYCSLD